jgi:hypothetical protein
LYVVEKVPERVSGCLVAPYHQFDYRFASLGIKGHHAVVNLLDDQVDVLAVVLHRGPPQSKYLLVREVELPAASRDCLSTRHDLGHHFLLSKGMDTQRTSFPGVPR